MPADATAFALRLTVNGQAMTVDIPTDRLLADVLRLDLGLTGTKVGCSIGVCGSCSVLIDGQLASACLSLAVTLQDRSVTTVEGLAHGEVLHRVQRAFLEHGAFQCGICTPGQVVAAAALLDEDSDPDEATVRMWMAGNLCRCTGYSSIVDAVRTASRERAAAEAQVPIDGGAA